jgi:predicted MFS family arabinose efflux permease
VRGSLGQTDVAGRKFGSARLQELRELGSALTSTLGVSAVVFGIVHSANAGWTDAQTVLALVVGVALIGWFVRSQRRSLQPLMPLRLFVNRERSGAYLARFLFYGALLSFYFFTSQYPQGVSGDSPLEAGLAFLPAPLAAFAAAAATARLARRFGNAVLAIAGCAAMLLGTVWISRLSVDTGYITGIAVPMVIFGIGQGFGLSALTTAGMAGVDRDDAGVAGGLVNVAHHTGRALGLGLTTVFAASGAGAHTAQQLLAARAAGSLTGASVFVAIALLITLGAHPHDRRMALRRRNGARRLAAVQTPGHPGAEPPIDSRSAA